MELKLSGVDLNMLVAFDVLLQEGSVTRAATRLGVTQPAMSHTLRRLRELFNDPLFVRGQRGLAPTPRAEALAAPVRQGLIALQRALDGPEGFDPSRSDRRFVISTTDFIGLMVIPPLLSCIADEAPRVDLDVRPFDSRNYPADLESGDLDLALGVFVNGNPVEGGSPPGMMGRKVFDSDFVCVVRADHPDIHGPLTLEQYVAMPHALISPQGRGPSVVDIALEQRGLTRRVALRVPQFVLTPLLIARSNLVLTAPRRLAETFAAVFPLRLLEPPLDLPVFSVHMIWHERFHQDPANQWLRELMTRAVTQAHSYQAG